MSWSDYLPICLVSVPVISLAYMHIWHICIAHCAIVQMHILHGVEMVQDTRAPNRVSDRGYQQPAQLITLTPRYPRQSCLHVWAPPLKYIHCLSSLPLYVLSFSHSNCKTWVASKKLPRWCSLLEYLFFCILGENENEMSKACKSESGPWQRLVTLKILPFLCQSMSLVGAFLVASLLNCHINIANWAMLLCLH